MKRGFIRAIAISAAIMLGVLALGIHIAFNRPAYSEATEQFGDVLFTLPVGLILGALAILAVVIIGVGGPLVILSKVRRWRARREDGDLGKYDDPDYLERD